MTNWFLATVGAFLLGLCAAYLFLRLQRRATHMLVSTLVPRLQQISRNSAIQSESLDHLLHLLQWPRGTLPATRGWAASPDFLVIITELVLRNRPSLVVEFGTGVTSLVISRALELNGEGRLISVDHDSFFAEQTRERLTREGLKSECRCAPLKLRDGESGEPWYDFPVPDERIDMMVIDGPPMEFGETVRQGASRYFEKLTEEAVVLLDDASRPGEMKLAAAWKKEWPDLSQTFLATEKGTLILRKGSPASPGEEA